MTTKCNACSYLGSYTAVAGGCYQEHYWGFSGGSVVKNPPANAEDRCSIPGLGRSHMLQCTSLFYLLLCATTAEPVARAQEL